MDYELWIQDYGLWIMDYGLFFLKNFMKKNNLIVEKTFDFSLKSIDLFKNLQDEKEFIISNQFLRCATSIGANVNESISAISKKDFIHKLSISLKEARECKYWLLLLEKSNLFSNDLSLLLSEIESIIKILTSIILSSNKNSNP